MTEDAINHPLQNYTFGSPYEAGEIDQPEFRPANIKPVAVTEVRPMPDDSDDMENNILYVKTGRIEREYNGTPDIDLGEDVQDAPELFLRNARGADIPLSLDDNLAFQVSFFDKDVEYDNGNIIDKDILTSVAGFNHDSITLSDNGLRDIEQDELHRRNLQQKTFGLAEIVRFIRFTMAKQIGKLQNGLIQLIQDRRLELSQSFGLRLRKRTKEFLSVLTKTIMRLPLRIVMQVVRRQSQ